MFKPNLEIYLSLVAGRGFGFVNSRFKIVATLDGNIIETDYFECGQAVDMNSDLVWASTKESIRAMRNYKVPVRLDFQKEGETGKKNFGYIILNMKTARMIPPGNPPTIELKQETYKVCGTGKEAIGSHPEVDLSLRIQEPCEIDAVPQPEVSGRDPELKTYSPNCHHESPVSCSRDSASVIKEVGGTGDSCKALQNIHSFTVEVTLKECNWKSKLENVHVRFHHCKAEVNWSAHDEISATTAGQTMEFNSLSCKLTFLERPSEMNSLLTQAPPSMSICEMKEGRPNVLGVASLTLPSCLAVEKIEGRAQVRSIDSKEEIATIFYAARLLDNGPQTVQQLSIAGVNEILGETIEDELQVWKKNERKKYEEEFDKKLQTALLQQEVSWANKMSNMEKEAGERVKICQSLCDELQKIMDEARERDSLHQNNYQSLVEETKRDTQSIRGDLMARLIGQDIMISNLQSQMENLSLQLKKEGAIPSILPIEHNECPQCDTKGLEEKLQAANEGKAFFKNQWIRAVRELHRVKTGGVSDIPVKMKFTKEQLQQLGLAPLLDDIPACRDS